MVAIITWLACRSVLSRSFITSAKVLHYAILIRHLKANTAAWLAADIFHIRRRDTQILQQYYFRGKRKKVLRDPTVLSGGNQTSQYALNSSNHSTAHAVFVLHKLALIGRRDFQLRTFPQNVLAWLMKTFLPLFSSRLNACWLNYSVFVQEGKILFTTQGKWTLQML